METKELTIAGMSCGHCVISVKKALGDIRGVTIEDVQIGKARIRVDTSSVYDAMFVEAIENAGYKLLSIR